MVSPPFSPLEDQSGLPRSACKSQDADPSAVEMDGSLGQGEEGVVPSASDVVAGAELRSALADDDTARRHVLAAEDLDAEILGVGIAPVAGGTLSLFMGHLYSSPSYS